MFNNQTQIQNQNQTQNPQVNLTVNCKISITNLNEIRRFSLNTSISLEDFKKYVIELIKYRFKEKHHENIHVFDISYLDDEKEDIKITTEQEWKSAKSSVVEGVVRIKMKVSKKKKTKGKEKEKNDYSSDEDVEMKDLNEEEEEPFFNVKKTDKGVNVDVDFSKIPKSFRRFGPGMMKGFPHHPFHHPHHPFHHFGMGMGPHCKDFGPHHHGCMRGMKGLGMGGRRGMGCFKGMFMGNGCMKGRNGCCMKGRRGMGMKGGCMRGMGMGKHCMKGMRHCMRGMGMGKHCMNGMGMGMNPDCPFKDMKGKSDCPFPGFGLGHFMNGIINHHHQWDPSTCWWAQHQKKDNKKNDDKESEEEGEQEQEQE